MTELSVREREVFDLVIGGLSICEISRRLWVSNETTKTHLANIRKKLGVGRMTDLRAVGIIAEIGLAQCP